VHELQGCLPLKSDLIMAANNGAAKRLRKELLLLERAAAKAVRKGRSTSCDEDDVYLRPSSPDSILRWTALIKGPCDVSICILLRLC
jgi:hypothetical protein